MLWTVFPEVEGNDPVTYSIGKVLSICYYLINPRAESLKYNAGDIIYIC